jgi:hypothetical protein
VGCALLRAGAGGNRGRVRSLRGNAPYESGSHTSEVPQRTSLVCWDGESPSHPPFSPSFIKGKGGEFSQRFLLNPLAIGWSCVSVGRMEKVRAYKVAGGGAKAQLQTVGLKPNYKLWG